ncbi:MAG: DNA recombination protein RmuC [Holophagaceae bacterium]|nr:DNA recombination protein RmuC [Holophagaceae bacterium]
MDVQIIFNIIIVSLLFVLIAMSFFRKVKSDTGMIYGLLKQSGEELRDGVAKQISNGATEQFARFDVIQASIQSTLQGIREETNRQLQEFQSRITEKLMAIQQSGAESNNNINVNVNKTLQETRTETNDQLGKFSSQLDMRLSSIQEQVQKTLQSNREETNKQLNEIQARVDSKLTSMQKGSTEGVEKINATLENKMKSLQESNEKRLEQMQGVVDEKLQKTLETRLTQSFEVVSKHLENVQLGLGEMKNLAADAKSLKNALINVKERGTYGEVRLEKLLSDILAPTQYEMNIEISNSKRVEFAIKLPGSGDAPLLLPIDSKFPVEDYNRLLDAEDKQAIDEARKALAQKVKSFAKDIFDKYIAPPKTTDFALMFLPTEGLFAEVIRNAALFEELREKYKIHIVGPTTLSAYLGSLQVGFKTLAIEQRSQEVWNTLRAVKHEFGKFGDTLSQAQKQIRTADMTLEKIVGTRTRAIEKRLQNVEELTLQTNIPQLDFNELDEEL